MRDDASVHHSVAIAGVDEVRQLSVCINNLYREKDKLKKVRGTYCIAVQCFSVCPLWRQVSVCVYVCETGTCVTAVTCHRSPTSCAVCPVDNVIHFLSVDTCIGLSACLFHVTLFLLLRQTVC